MSGRALGMVSGKALAAGGLGATFHRITGG